MKGLGRIGHPGGGQPTVDLQGGGLGPRGTLQILLDMSMWALESKEPEIYLKGQTSHQPTDQWGDLGKLWRLQFQPGTWIWQPQPGQTGLTREGGFLWPSMSWEPGPILRTGSTKYAE